MRIRVPYRYVPNSSFTHMVVIGEFQRPHSRVELIPMFYIRSDEIRGGWEVTFLGELVTDKTVRQIAQNDIIRFEHLNDVQMYIYETLNPEL